MCFSAKVIFPIHVIGYVGNSMKQVKTGKLINKRLFLHTSGLYMFSQHANCSFVSTQEVGYIPDKVVKGEKRITAHPYDTEAWSVLIRDAQVGSFPA